MDVEGVVPVLNVSDLLASFAWFEKIGWEKRWEWGEPPDFGAVGSGVGEIFLCEQCQGSRATETQPDAGTWMSWFLGSPEAVDAAHARAVEYGLTVLQPPQDMPWNVRECHLRHPDGHVFRVGAPLGVDDLPSRVRAEGPPLEIERVNVPVRLEKRLASLLRDLAEHKGMSVDSCLEETLLHTFERMGGGVASPHAPTTFPYIRDLKEKHGIEYDVHASYRFVES